MTARDLVESLGGRWYGSYGMARCPIHADRTPSLKVVDAADNSVNVHCFAGCSWKVVKDALRCQGLLPGGAESVTQGSDPKAQERRKVEQLAEEHSRIEAARKIWLEARSAKGTLVEMYLRERGITIPIPPTIRYAPNLKHGPTGMMLPAMVCAVQRPNRRVTGIHRTFLRADGKAKTPFTNPKMMLGHCAGGAVRLAAAGQMLIVGEGIETTLSIYQATKTPAWAALSTSGLRSLTLPPIVHEVVIAADGDPPGEEAAQAAAAKWTGEGRKVRIARPPDGFDFNDVLSGKCTSKMEAAS